MIAVLALLFVLSGAAALFYEAVWSRYLSRFIGHDAYAQISSDDLLDAAGRSPQAACDLLRPYSIRSEGDVRLARRNSYVNGARSPAP